MTQKLLNVAQVYALFQEMGGESMPESMDGNLLLNSGPLSSDLKDLFCGTDMHWSTRSPFEKPAPGPVDLQIFEDGGLSVL